MRPFVHLFLSGVAFFPKTMPEAERVKRLAPHFDPPPTELLKLDPLELVNMDKKRPFSARGFIKVTPPVGQCWIITKKQSKQDKRICQASVVSFELNDVQKNGILSWEISTGPSDMGTKISWQTPYRVARIIPQGGLFTEAPQSVPLLSCKRKTSINGQRQIVLKTGFGETWSITFPEKDDKLPEPKPEPNLYHTYGTSSGSAFQKKSVKGTKIDNTDYYRDVVVDPDDVEANNEANTKKEKVGLSRVLKGGDKRTYYTYSFGTKGAYVMPSDAFTNLGSPRGLLGKCRYKYVGAKQDPASGVIDCYLTDTYDSVVMPLSCSAPYEP